MEKIYAKPMLVFLSVVQTQKVSNVWDDCGSEFSNFSSDFVSSFSYASGVDLGGTEQ